MNSAISTAEAHWLPLREASRILNVNEATLRQWADRGNVKVFRTPGGHRRFFRDDLLALLARDGTGPTYDARQRWEESLLKRIRHRLQQANTTEQMWYRAIDEEGRLRMRLYGRRLLSLLVQATSQGKRRQQLLAEAQLVGREYGLEMASRGLPLKDTIEAFILFRNLGAADVEGQPRQRISLLTDQVLLGITEAYQQPVANPPDVQKVHHEEAS